MDASFNHSRIELFSPPKDANSLLFGSGSSSEDELVSRSSTRPPMRANTIARAASLVYESPIKAEESENRENGARRSLMKHFSRSSPRLTPRQHAQQPSTSSSNGASNTSVAHSSRLLKDANVIDSEPFNSPLDLLEKGAILTPKHERVITNILHSEKLLLDPL